MNVFTKLLNCLVPKQLDTEIKYTQSNKFKLTITSGGAIRIKIPEGMNSNQERVWVERCKSIGQYFLKNPFEFTLRTDARIPMSDMVLRTGDKHRQFLVRNHKVTLIENKEKIKWKEN
jgi:hypothetical protein